MKYVIYRIKRRIKEKTHMKLNVESVRLVLERIAVRGKDDGERFVDSSRVDAIADCLADSDWRLYEDGCLAKIYAHKDFDPQKPVVVVSSHVDMVAEQCYAESNGEMWKGSFDNLITNAIVVACMKNGLFTANTLVAFTGDEECDSGGADEVAEFLAEKYINVKLVAVTDVTDEGWLEGKHFTIENILPEDDARTQRRMEALLKSAVADIDPQPCVVVEGEPDEAWEYDEFDLPCCSVCMPCLGDMHSEEGVEIRSAALVPYAQALVADRKSVV